MKYTCLNPIASVGLDQFTEGYEKTEKMEDADAVLVRSAAMHDLELPDGLYAVARAGAGVNNIPLDKCAEKGIVVFNTPGANANGVKELVIAGLLLASRDIVGGIHWVQSLQKHRKRKRRNLQVLRSQAKSLVSSDLVRSVSRWQTWQNVWVWMYMAMIRTFLLMRHGNFPKA